MTPIINNCVMTSEYIFEIIALLNTKYFAERILWLFLHIQLKGCEPFIVTSTVVSRRCSVSQEGQCG